MQPIAKIRGLNSQSCNILLQIYFLKLYCKNEKKNLILPYPVIMRTCSSTKKKEIYISHILPVAYKVLQLHFFPHSHVFTCYTYFFPKIFSASGIQKRNISFTFSPSPSPFPCLFPFLFSCLFPISFFPL